MHILHGMSTRWHYLVGRLFVPAWREGLLRMSPDPELLKRQGVDRAPEGYYDCRPVVWFSVAEPWEPSTAIKVRGPDGTMQFVRDIDENARRGGGLFRVGVAPETAPISWTDYRKGGFDRPDVCNRMAKAARDLRADPQNWWASDVPVPRALWTAVEEWKGGAWVPYTPPARDTVTI